MNKSEIAYYLYCFTPSRCGLPASLIGVDERHAVSMDACGEIGAVLSPVELGDFRGAEAQARLEDLAWLGPRVLRHAAVIEALMSRAPVLPARFATLFTSIERIGESAMEHRAAIGRFFAELGDQQEWGVKGLLDRAGGPRHPDEGAPAASTGARYFEEKRAKIQLERDFNFQLKNFCRRAAETLGAKSGGFRERKVALWGEPGTGVEVVLNWAFLLAPGALDEFHAKLDRLNAGEVFSGLALTLSGPWPPYSFAPDLSRCATA